MGCWTEAGATHLFCKWSESKYFRFCRPKIQCLLCIFSLLCCHCLFYSVLKRQKSSLILGWIWSTGCSLPAWTRDFNSTYRETQSVIRTHGHILLLCHVLMVEGPVWSPLGSVFRNVGGNDDWFSQRKATGFRPILHPSQGLSLLFNSAPCC